MALNWAKQQLAGSRLGKYAPLVGRAVLPTNCAYSGDCEGLLDEAASVLAAAGIGDFRGNGCYPPDAVEMVLVTLAHPDNRVRLRALIAAIEQTVPVPDQR